MNFLIIHGIYGNPEENWLPWLKTELEKKDHKVYIPTFPTPENQNLTSWIEAFQSYTRYVNKDTILIGKSDKADLTASPIPPAVK